MLFTLIGWAIYGLIVGILGKILVSFFLPDAPKTVTNVGPTILVGVLGSYIGGLLNYVLFSSSHLLDTSGIVMGSVGAAIGLAGLYYYNLKGLDGITNLFKKK